MQNSIITLNIYVKCLKIPIQIAFPCFINSMSIENETISLSFMRSTFACVPLVHSSVIDTFYIQFIHAFVDHEPLVFSSFKFLFFFWGGGRGTIKQFIWNQFELKRFKNKNKEKHINEQSAVAFDTHCLTMCYSYPTFIEPNNFISNWITFHLTTFCYLPVPNPPTRPYPPIYQRDSIELNQFCTVQWQ